MFEINNVLIMSESKDSFVKDSTTARVPDSEPSISLPTKSFKFPLSVTSKYFGSFQVPSEGFNISLPGIYISESKL